MSLHLYKDTMEQLSHLLSYKLQKPVSFSQKSVPIASDLKWASSEDESNFLFPINMNLIPSGHLQVDSSVGKQHLNEIFSMIQWTLMSLEEILEKYNIKISSNLSLNPVLLQDLPNKNAVDLAHDVYENSQAQFFIKHNDDEALNRSVFSAELKQTLIFISDLASLNHEDQVFLSHYLSSRNSGPMILGATSSETKVLKSLLDSFSSVSPNMESEMKSKLRTV